MRGNVNHEHTSVTADLAFRFVSGHRALDLLSTLANRHREPLDRLRRPADLDRWLAYAGLPVDALATDLDLADARLLRETVNRITRTALAGEAPAESDVAELNVWACRPAVAPQLDPALARHWSGEPPVRAALALLAREAVELLTGSDLQLVRECAAAPNCSLLYIDRSRAHSRRWCDMERCGSRAKMTSYRRRRSASPPPG